MVINGCEKCGVEHLTHNGQPACPGHITSGKRKGAGCTHELGFGTSHKGAGCCKFHGGSTPNQTKAANLELARQEFDKLGLELDVEPTEALLREVREAAGNVEFFRYLIQQLPTHPGPDEMIGVSEKGDPIFSRGDTGIYGNTYHLSGIPTGEAKEHILVKMYNDERKHLVNVAKIAISLGIEERRVRLEENHAVEVFRAITIAFSAMGLVDRFNEFRSLFSDALNANNRPLPAGIGSRSKS